MLADRHRAKRWLTDRSASIQAQLPMLDAEALQSSDTLKTNLSVHTKLAREAAERNAAAAALACEPELAQAPFVDLHTASEPHVQS